MPQTLVGFAAVRGHERVREFLRAAVAHERLPHALLFVGPEGVGKRSLALALMTWLQCEHGGDDACGRCAACLQMAARSHLDFQLVTVAPGKKEVGIDRIREIKRFMQLRPVGDKAKLALIDDAHLLTVAAQNALLKVLEEPPTRSFLVLVSNNPDALLATVRSRCQRLHFGPLPIDTVVDILTAGSDLDAGTARELAVLAEGSPGRALTLRKCLAGESQEQWRLRLAGLDQARYVRLTQTASELNSPESQVAAKLEMLLSQLRDDAVRPLRADEPEPDPSAGTATSLRTMLQRADAVERAWQLIRRANPNRQLLLEALLLRLAGS